MTVCDALLKQFENQFILINNLKNTS